MWCVRNGGVNLYVFVVVELLEVVCEVLLGIIHSDIMHSMWGGVVYPLDVASYVLCCLILFGSYMNMDVSAVFIKECCEVFVIVYGGRGEWSAYVGVYVCAKFGFAGVCVKGCRGLFANRAACACYFGRGCQ